MRLPVLAAVFTASTLISMSPSPRWMCDKLLHGLDTLFGQYSASEAADAKFVVAGKSVRSMAMTPSVPAAVATLTGLSPHEGNRRMIEKRLERSTVGRVIDALTTASVGKTWLWSSSVRELVDNVMNVSSCPTKTSTSKRSTCGMGLSSCIEACDGGLWFKPVPGACHLVCTMAEEHCTRCKKKRTADVDWSRSAQDSWPHVTRSGFIQTTYDLDLPQHSWFYALSILLTIAGFFYQSANHARQIRHIFDQVDSKLAGMKDDIRDLVAETILETMEQNRRQQEGHNQLLETGYGAASNRNSSSGTDDNEEVHGDDDEREANGDREQPHGEDTGVRGSQDVGGGGGDGDDVAQATAGAEAPEQEEPGLVGSIFGFAVGWARDCVGV